MASNKEDRNQQQSSGREEDSQKQQVSGQEARQQMDELEQEAEKNRTKKPGSQSQSGGQHNNGRGGGK